MVREGGEGVAVRGDNLIQNLLFWARTTPGKTAIDVDGARLSYAELDRRSDEMAAGLAALGIGKGDRVGILMRNRVEFAEAMYAIMKAGAAIVLLNIRYTPAEIRHPITDAGLTAILTESALLPLVADAPAYAPGLRLFSADPADGAAPLEELRRKGAARPDIDIDGADIALVSYTSGTTGVPKGAMLSHGAIYAAGAARACFVGHSFRERMLLPMPLAYTAGAVFFMRDGVNAGCTTWFLRQPTGEAMLGLIERERITSVQGVTVLFEAMLQSPRFASTDLSSLTHALTGGAMVTRHLLEAWQARGVQLVQGYGQTESAGSHIAILAGEDAKRKMGFCGRPMPNLDLRIVDGEGNALPPGTPGEIWVRGSSIMTGYLNRPEETAAALAGGWLHTGDIGLLDAEGYLKILDRTKDMLISGGLNVYPAEIEKVLGDVPGLEEFCIIGVPDPRWGEVPMIVASGSAPVDMDRLLLRCRQELADYKRPRYLVRHADPMPRTLSGKITKGVLRALYCEVPEDAVLLCY